MQEIIENITKVIEDYNSSNNHHPQGLIDMGRNLSANLYFLEKFRAQKHKEFEAIIYALRLNGSKVNAATNEANVKVPELYMLRRLMGSAERTAIQMSVELSFMKAELNNIGKNV